MKRIFYLLSFFSVYIGYGQINNNLRKSAEQGDARSQFFLGFDYGRKGDLRNAFYWFSKSANQEDADAQFFLALAYKNGEGTEKSKEKAEFWFKKSAELGNADAQLYLGMLYLENEEDSKAIYWYKKSAIQGNLVAQYLLAESYYSGDGVKQDYDQVAFWCSKAANQEIDENDEVERNILARSQYRLSGLYIEGKGVNFSKEKGMYWLRKSCENFYDKACETLNKLKKMNNE